MKNVSTPDTGSGGKANLAAFTDSHVKQAYTGKPAITFPASIAVVRVQDSGSGDYTVVSTRELETAADYDALAKNPGISGVASLNRLLLTDSASSAVTLREAPRRRPPHLHRRLRVA